MAETDLARVCATDYARPIGAPQNVATIKKVRQSQERQDSAGLQKSLFLDRHLIILLILSGTNDQCN